jgi:dihydrofolate synthase/folylpolyglutamate synthase
LFLALSFAVARSILACKHFQARRAMNYDQSVRYLLTLGRELASPQQARAAKFDLENIRILAEHLGNPQRAFRSVHVAGTNGKGSTAAMLAGILTAAGLRAGLYTSPHLLRINERIRIGSEAISDADFAAAFTRIHAAIERLLASGALAAHPTYFECVTAMAFDYFARQKVDVAVIEVGMGGRLDSTNIIVPELAVITQIDFDHENFLGHSIEEIAAEKAGIIKDRAWVVSAARNSAAAEVIRRRTVAQAARLLEVDRAYSASVAFPDVCGSRLQPRLKVQSGPALAADVRKAHAAAEIDLESGCYRFIATENASNWQIEITLPLPGRFQIENALTAVAAARLLVERGFAIDDAAMTRGLASVRWPGRLQRVLGRPAVYLDGTHNPAGARELVAFWEKEFSGRRIHLVYGAMRDKAVDEIAGLLFPRAASVILTQSPQPRSISAHALAALTRHLAPSFEVIPEPGAALERALELAAPDDVVFATGSLYLVGDWLRHWHDRTALDGRSSCPGLAERSSDAHTAESTRP